MKLKKMIRFFLLVFAFSLFIGNIYISGYSHALGYRSPQPEYIALMCMVNLMVGVIILISAALIGNDKSKAKEKRFTIIFGLFVTFGSIIALICVLPMFPAS